MGSRFQQAVVVGASNAKGISRRFWLSMSMVVSVALVVAVLCGFNAMLGGFRNAMNGAGSDRVAVVVAGGARTEQGSRIPPKLLHRLLASNEDLGIARRNGMPLISAELVVPVDARLKGGTDIQTISLRGMEPAGFALRRNVTLTAGRLPTPGAAEIVVGADAARRYAGLAIGDTVTFGATRWKVVGRFSAGGSVFESEVWSSLSAVQSEFNRQGEVQSLRIGLTKPDATAPLQAFLNRDAGAPVTVLTGRAFYAGQSRRLATIIREFGYPVALLMALGAIAGALNTMHSSVADRATEIATLRAIGFSGAVAFFGTLMEALLLTLGGIVLGVLVSVLLFDGWHSSTHTAGGQVGFALHVSSGSAAQSALLALAVGVFGGAWPAFRAARMPVLRAMRPDSR